VITIAGMLLVIIGFVGIHIGWKANEWREPIMEIEHILMERKSPKVRKLHSQLKTKGTIAILFILFLYVLGSIFIYIEHPFVWLLILEILVFVWLTKGVVSLIISTYSRKIRLLNYLYSPYLFAWRRDHLSGYTDEQIASAICEASGVDFNQLSISGNNLDQFLIELCNRTRPKHEVEQYPEVLKQRHKIADDMVWSR